MKGQAEGAIFAFILLVVMLLFINSLNMPTNYTNILYLMWVVFFFSWVIYIIKFKK